MAEPTWRHKWRWFLAPLAIAALVWTGWLLSDALPNLQHNLSKLNLGWFTFTVVGNIVSGYLAFEAFRFLFNHMQPGKYGRLELAHLYFTGQLMKHVPGRIWGVAYQSYIGRGTTMAEWVSVNSVYMILISGFGFWVVSSSVAFSARWHWGAATVVIGAGVYWFTWQRGLLEFLLSGARKVRLTPIQRLCDAMRPFVNVGGRLKVQFGAWMAASWLVYFLAWASFGMAWPGLSAAGGVQLCAFYTAAWMVGYLSLITPSGIGVRELTFVLLANQFPGDAVAAMAVLGRVVLLLVDLVLGAIFIIFRGSTYE